MKILIFIWLISWIANIIVAWKKGGTGQGCLGVLTGLLLGPIALFMTLTYEGKQCVYCKSNMKKGARVCPKCSREQP